jgi:hypothetical protein
MAIDAWPPLDGFGDPRAPNPNPSSLFFGPLGTLLLAIDSQSRVQDMDDEVVYYVNRDSAGWVEQHVRRHVYIELKLECYGNRTRNEHRARDDWVCVYCRGTFPSKLRLTDHRCSGCSCGPVNSRGLKWQLPVYPNLKTAKQGKDLKLALQRGDVWDNLQDEEVWFSLNPELLDVAKPPPGARVHARWFMEPTLETLLAQPAPNPTSASQQPRSQGRSKAAIPPIPSSAPPMPPAFVDIPNDTSDEAPAPPPPPRPHKRRHAEMDEGHRPSFSKRQHRPKHREERPPQPPRPQQPGSAGFRVPPPHPIRVTPIQTRNPSPERVAILAPPSAQPASNEEPAPPPTVSPSSHSDVQPDAPPPPVTPVPPETPREEEDLAESLRTERQAFYLRAASAAQGTMTMDVPKPALRPSIQPPGLFYLIPCGLLDFDVDRGKYEDFEDQIEEWRAARNFMDRLFAAYGRFHSASYQVTITCSFHASCFCTVSSARNVAGWVFLQP